MRDPAQVTSRDAVLRAIAEYDELGQAAFLSKYGYGPSTKYDLVHDGQRYDAKAILGVAYGYQFPDDGPLRNRELHGGENQTNPILRKMGFEIAPHQAHSRQPATPVEPARRWWWVNQGQTYPAERAEQILWAPLLSKNGIKQGHWETMAEVARGDYILHYSQGALRAVSTARGPAENAPKPPSLPTDAWERDGRLVRSAYVDLAPPIRLEDVPAEWRQNEGGPFNRLGGVNQGYLFPISSGFALQLLAQFPHLTAALDMPAPPAPPPAQSVSLHQVYAEFRSVVDATGLVIPTGPEDRVRSLLASLIAKRFAILSGLSGSGKTQLALKLGEWFGSGANGPRLLPVPVRPDWTGPESLFGYEDALREKKNGRAAWHVPNALMFMLEAAKDPTHPYLLLLDEMNLAHVERYFSDFLSGVESGKPVLPNLVRGDDGEWRLAEQGPAQIPLPANLFVVGTVNVDETTYMFSPKVLDRAFTFEVRTATDELNPQLEQPSSASPGASSTLAAFVSHALNTSLAKDHPHPQQEHIMQSLLKLHEALSLSGDEFGHRTMFESARLAAAIALLGESDADVALDHILMLKLLPRVHGSRRRVEPVLQMLLRFAQDPARSLEELRAPLDAEDPARLNMSARKLSRMLTVVQINQFVSFTE